jgi:hypothetical protein
MRSPSSFYSLFFVFLPLSLWVQNCRSRTCHERALDTSAWALGLTSAGLEINTGEGEEEGVQSKILRGQPKAGHAPFGFLRTQKTGHSDDACLRSHRNFKPLLPSSFSSSSPSHLRLHEDMATHYVDSIHFNIQFSPSPTSQEQGSTSGVEQTLQPQQTLL